MAAPELLVILLLASGELGQPSTAAMSSAARQALGPGARVVVIDATDMVSDDDATLLSDMLGADAVVEVSFYPPKRERATIHLRVTASAEWRDRELKFAPADAEAERGRTLGFAIGAMMPAGSSGTPEPSPSPEKPPSPPMPPPRPPPRPERPIAPPTAPAVRPAPYSVEASLLAVTGVGGPAGGMGGEVAGRARLSSILAARLALGGRIGQIAFIGGTSSTVQLDAGVALRTAITPGFALGLRADLFLGRTSVSRVSFDLGPESRARWLPGSSLMAEGHVRLFGWTALLVSTGAELSFGTTELVVDGRTLSTIPYLRILAAVGLITAL